MVVGICLVLMVSRPSMMRGVHLTISVYRRYMVELYKLYLANSEGSKWLWRRTSGSDSSTWGVYGKNWMKLSLVAHVPNGCKQ